MKTKPIVLFSEAAEKLGFKTFFAKSGYKLSGNGIEVTVPNIIQGYKVLQMHEALLEKSLNAKNNVTDKMTLINPHQLPSSFVESDVMKFTDEDELKAHIQEKYDFELMFVPTSEISLEGLNEEYSKQWEVKIVDKKLVVISGYTHVVQIFTNGDDTEEISRAGLAWSTYNNETKTLLENDHFLDGYYSAFGKGRAIRAFNQSVQTSLDKLNQPKQAPRFKPT